VNSYFTLKDEFIFQCLPNAERKAKAEPKAREQVFLGHCVLHTHILFTLFFSPLLASSTLMPNFIHLPFYSTT